MDAATTKLLDAELDTAKIKQRPDNKKIDYIEGVEVFYAANRIFGYDGWDSETIMHECIFEEPRSGKPGVCACYKSKVRVTIRTLDGRVSFKEGIGYGDSEGTVRSKVHDTAGKAAETDAQKRALAKFGNQFGLALYLKKDEETHQRAHGVKNYAEEAEFLQWKDGLLERIRQNPNCIIAMTNDDSGRLDYARANYPDIAADVDAAISDADAAISEAAREKMHASWTKWLADYKAALDGKTGEQIDEMQKASKPEIANLKAFDAALFADLKEAVTEARQKAAEIDPSEDGATPDTDERPTRASRAEPPRRVA